MKDQKLLLRDLKRHLRISDREARAKVRNLAHARQLTQRIAESVDAGKRLTSAQVNHSYYTLGYRWPDGSKPPKHMIALLGYDPWADKYATPSIRIDNLGWRTSAGGSDPLAEAANIVRTASTGGIDWTKEPRDGRERTIRWKVLTRRYASDTYWYTSLMHDMGLLGMGVLDLPSDVNKFMDEISERKQKERQESELPDLSEDLQYEANRAAREIDGLPPLDDESGDDFDDDEEEQA